MSILLLLIDLYNIYDTFRSICRLDHVGVKTVLRDHLIYISVTFSCIMFHICLDIATICIAVTTVLSLVCHSDQILSNIGGHVH